MTRALLSVVFTFTVVLSVAPAARDTGLLGIVCLEDSPAPCVWDCATMGNRRCQ